MAGLGEANQAAFAARSTPSPSNDAAQGRSHERGSTYGWWSVDHSGDAAGLPTGIACFYPGNPSDSLGVDVSFNGYPQGPDGPQPGFWSRFSTGQIVAMVIAVAVVAICFMGMLIGLIADAGSPDETATESESPTETATEASPTPSESASPTAEPTTEAPSSEAVAETEAAEEGAGASEVYFENCDAARDAGAAPVYAGDPGYRSGLDGDGDGVGCEDSSGGGGSGGDSGGDDGGDSGGDDGDDGGSVYYENCDAVRAAGAAPIHEGDAGYGSHLDRDGDGVACE